MSNDGGVSAIGGRGMCASASGGGTAAVVGSRVCL